MSKPIGESQAREPQRESESAKQEDKRSADFIKDQLIILSFLVLYVGIVDTEAYYSAFGVRYQLLSFPSFHVMYRGLTAVRAAWYLAIPYVLILLWFYFEERHKDRLSPGTRILVSSMMAIVLVSISYPIAQYVGFQEAYKDMNEKTSRLPMIACLRYTDDKECRYQHHRLLLSIGDEIILFQPVSRPSYPNVIHLKRGGVDEFTTSQVQ